MKKGLKDFLTGVGSVLDISPISSHKVYRINVTLRPPKDLQFDLDTVGEDFRTIGKDLESVIHRAFSESQHLSKKEAIERHESILAEMDRLDSAVKRLQQISTVNKNSEAIKDDVQKKVLNQY